MSARVVAILSSNDALASILHMVLASRRDLRVRRFESATALTAYMRIAPVDLLVHDSDSEPVDAVMALRSDPMVENRGFATISLFRSVSPALREISVKAGIDEVIMKPMSPDFLLERVTARLGEQRAYIAGGAYNGPERRSRVRMHKPEPLKLRRASDSNVVNLFGPRETV